MWMYILSAWGGWDNKRGVESRIAGTFLGYDPCVVHRLDDGMEWKQVGKVETNRSATKGRDHDPLSRAAR